MMVMIIDDVCGPTTDADAAAADADAADAAAAAEHVAVVHPLHAIHLRHRHCCRATTTHGGTPLLTPAADPNR